MSTSTVELTDLLIPAVLNTMDNKKSRVVEFAKYHGDAVKGLVHAAMFQLVHEDNFAGHPELFVTSPCFFEPYGRKADSIQPFCEMVFKFYSDVVEDNIPNWFNKLAAQVASN